MHRLNRVLHQLETGSTTTNNNEQNINHKNDNNLRTEHEPTSSIPVAMVIGAGDGLGAACAHRFAKAGYRVVVVRRNRQKLQSLIDSINRAYSLRDLQACHGFGVDCRKEGSVQALFTTVERTIGAVHVTIFNIGANVRFNIRDTTARVFRKVWEMATFAGFLVGREAAKVMTKRQCRWSCDKGPARVDNADHNDNNNNTDNNKNSHVDHDNDTAMATNGSKFNLDHHHPSYTNMPSSSPLPAAAGSHGTIIFTGATASLRGSAGFAAFSAAKAGLRMLAQSMARELGPEGIHVAHVVIDGAIDGPWIRENFDALVKKGVQKKTSANDTSSEGLDMCHLLSTASIAESYFHLHMQQPCAWTFELDLRPQRERW